MPHPITKCATDNIGEGCGRTYPKKTKAGLCVACEIIDKAEGEERVRKEQWGTCFTCGVLWQRLPYTNQCGQCHEEENGDQDRINHTIDEANRLRRDATNQRLRRGPANNALMGTSNQPTVPLTTAGLATFQNRGANDADLIKVVAQPKVNNKPENHLGNTTRFFRREVAVEEVIEELIKTINVPWEKRNAKSLTRGDVTLRLDGNQNIESHTESMTIGEFYDHHRRLGHFQILPKHAKMVKGNVLPIELAIDLLGFEDRTGMAAEGIHGKSSKRKVSGGTQLGTQVVKRSRVSGLQQGSIFIRKISNEAESPCTNVEIRYADISVEKRTCAVKVIWPVTAKTKTASIRDQVFAKGKTKEVYRITIDNEEFVAKRFVEIGKGLQNVTLRENSSELEKEVARLQRAKWFLEQFRDEAEDNDIEISNDFEFTNCFLVEEVISSPDQEPSPASGTTRKQIFAEYDLEKSTPMPKVCWMLEPLRTTTFTRYTGTLRHPDLRGKLGSSIQAFVHYAFVMSGEDLLFADIQGSVVRKPSGSSSNVLFDIMSHSSDGSTGVGDHGLDGISTWREQHKCNSVCADFSLKTVGRDETQTEAGEDE